MKNPLKKIQELIKVLPDKDIRICESYLSKRDFESILEIVESDIYKARKREPEELPNDYISDLIELRDELVTYMSYLDIPTISDNYDDY